MGDDSKRRKGATGGEPSATGRDKSGGDWASDLTGRLDEFVTKVRSQTTDRVIKVARIIVFGLVALIMGVMAVILLVIGTVRAVDNLVPQEVWLAYLLVGGLFTGAGLFLWSKKERRPPEGA